MAIDKSNSKPWVKVTVWVLTGALMFAFMGTGVWFLIANAGYLFSTQTYDDALQEYQNQQLNESEVGDEDIMLAYEQQIETLEAELKTGSANSETENLLAGMSASYAAWIYQRGDATEFPRGIELMERAIELDPETHEGSGALLIEQMKSALSE